VSRAFVKEYDDTNSVEEFADRPISSFRNLVTASRLKQIEKHIAELRTAYGKAAAALDKAATAKTSRDLRYWIARRMSAELIEPPKNSHVVRFGMRVTILRQNGQRQTFRIVGEDEADPTRGLLSYVSPLARSLIGTSQGTWWRAPQEDVSGRLRSGFATECFAHWAIKTVTKQRRDWTAPC
jgi:transcription elongation GreA/GreB family factor